ncbi:Bax inhibitor-1/YccA family protein [Microbacterium sp.]|uniref:Bax inhibitor-1/YccA family protein n=1 Tax=Microbacterium sp. TaxID=51671 RepID=UPI0025D60D4E|nr:Bax inhibitor-1/YccA family protein [Microbacterium sp.]MBT9606761.1 Bax inhibitor-1/YccA family protein [Microbacterium sp.]
MALNNPAFNTPAFQDPRAGAQTRYSPPPANTAAAAAETANIEGMYAAPSAGAVQTDRMTVEDTVFKTIGLFAILVVTAVVGWIWTMSTVTVANPSPNALPMIIGGLGGFVLAMVAIFKKKPSVPVFIAYAAFEGLFVGGISSFFEFLYPGIVVQATLATLSVVGVTLALFASGKIRASKRATKIFMIAMVGYLVFSLVNLGLMLFNVPLAGGAFGLRSSIEIFGIPLGVIIGVFVVIMAAYSLVLDFDQIQRGVRNGAPRVYGWVGAFGIMVTVVWLYVEILRILAILRGNN